MGNVQLCYFCVFLVSPDTMLLLLVVLGRRYIERRRRRPKLVEGKKMKRPNVGAINDDDDNHNSWC